MAHLATRAVWDIQNVPLRAHDPFESIHPFFQTVHPLFNMRDVPTDSDFDPAYFRADGVSSERIRSFMSVIRELL